MFTKRLVERVLIAAAIGFGAAFEASGWDFSKASIGLALAAAARTAYAFIVKNVGDPTKPDAVK